MTEPIEFRVVGVPAPQGSKRAFRNQHTNRIHMVESSKRVAPWRLDVKHAALAVLEERPGWELMTGPLMVSMTFLLPRPKGHWRTGRNAGLLRDSAPAYPAGHPDLSKLARSTEDALTGVIWHDDAQVVSLHALKSYAPTGIAPGCVIQVRPLPAHGAGWVSTFTHPPRPGHGPAPRGVA